MTPDAFYKSKGWLLAREAALARDNHLCQHCLKEGKLVPADMVHHIIYLEDAPEKGLDLDNLISLCNACHNKVHTEKGIIQKGERKIEVILGYPASGKTTYVRNKFQDGDLILDLDRILTAITFREEHDRNGNAMPAVRIANDIVSSLLKNIRTKGYCFGTLYVIRTRLYEDEYKSLRAAKARFYWLDVSRKTCRDRLWKSGRKDVIEALDKCDAFLKEFGSRLIKVKP